MMQFDPIPDPFARETDAEAEAKAEATMAKARADVAAAEAEAQDRAEAQEPAPSADEVRARARAAEARLTNALSALKHKGERAVSRVETAMGPTALVVGAAVAAGLGAVLLYAVVRAASRPRRRRRPTVMGTVAKSLVREAAGRMVIGAATTAGAQLAQTLLVPAIVATISARAASASDPERAPRPRKSRKAPVRREPIEE